jgi:NTE family protein
MGFRSTWNVTRAAGKIVTLANYLPSSEKIPNSVGLSLSGGGFRASLFHLGALRRLNEFGILPRLTTVSSVSGGSILNGFLASRLTPAVSSGIADFENSVSKPMQEFCSLDIRRWLALEAIIPGAHNSHGLAKQYDEHLTLGKRLTDIPSAPVHIFCTTDLAYGGNWMFRKERCGDYQAGFQDTPSEWLVSTAVAASSCFPPVFRPMNLNLDPSKLMPGRIPAGPQRDKCIREMTFSDGGVYDNLGLEPIWKNHEIVLCSDGGALFPIGGDTGFVWETSRFISIPENQALALRKRWLISNFVAKQLKGTYWGIGSSAYDYGIEQGYSSDLAKKSIAAIRTDLDSFSEAEASILENHGYWLADAAIRRHVPELLPALMQPIRVPHPDWAGPDEKIREALKDSGKRTLLGHG